MTTRRPIVTCPQCGRPFRTVQAARLHIRAYHIQRPAPDRRAAPTPKEEGMERVKK